MLGLQDGGCRGMELARQRECGLRSFFVIALVGCVCFLILTDLETIKVKRTVHFSIRTAPLRTVPYVWGGLVCKGF